MVAHHMVCIRLLSAQPSAQRMERQKVATVAVIGFIAVIFTYLGVNLLLSGLHAYGSLE